MKSLDMIICLRWKFLNANPVGILAGSALQKGFGDGSKTISNSSSTWEHFFYSDWERTIHMKSLDMIICLRWKFLNANPVGILAGSALQKGFGDGSKTISNSSSTWESNFCKSSLQSSS